MAAEDFILKLQQQASGATGAVAKLEAQIAKDAASMGKLGEATARAAEALKALQDAGDGSKKSEASIQRQTAALQALMEKARAAQAAVASLDAARKTAEGIDAAKAQQKADKESAAQASTLARQQAKEAREAARVQDASKREEIKSAKEADREAKRIAKEEERQAKEAERVMTRKRAIAGILGKDNTELANAAQAAGGPIGVLAGKIKEVASVMGEAGSSSKALAIFAGNFLLSALSRLVEVALAAAAAMVALAAAVTLYALHAADAARSSRLLNEAASAGARDHGELTMVINDIATRVPLAKDKIAEFGRALEVAGLQGRRMQIALEAVSMIESAIPGAGAKIAELAERFQKLRRAVLTKQDLQGTGLVLDDVAKSLAKLTNTSVAAAKAALQNGTASIDAVMKAMQAAIETKFGKTIAAQMLALSTQFEKLKENIAALFGDLNLENFLAGLKTVTDLFSQTTVTGKVLKGTMTLVFQGIFDGLAKVMPFVRSFFLGFMIGALNVYIALKPLIKDIGTLLGAGKGDGLHKALFLGSTLAHALGFGLKLVLLAVLQVVEVAKILSAAWDWISGVADELQKIPDVLQNLATTGMAAAGGLVEGFVNGIQAKIGDVIAAVSSMGDAAEGALRAALGWHSPATLGVDAAVAVGEGVEVGADKAEGKASDAMGSLVNPKSIKAGAKGAKAGGKVVYIENLTIGSKEAYAEFVAMLRREFEVEELGGEPA